jgi:hypothetical protein
LLSGVAAGLLVWQALRGTSPAVPLLRRAGIRTREEISREIYALKALRGDFEPVHKRGVPSATRASRALEAVAPEPEEFGPTASEEEMGPVAREI